MEFRNNEIIHGEDSLFYRSLFKPMGYSDYELDHKLFMGITNTWNTCVFGHFNLNRVNEFVKKGIYSAGGTAVEFSITGCRDGVAQGYIGMNYVLPSKEVIYNSIEAMVQTYRLDGTVSLTSCDKIILGMLTAAARLGIPAIVYVGGPVLGGIEFDRGRSDLTSIDEAKRMTRPGKIIEDECRSLGNMTCPGRGSCSFLGTTNSMCCVSEATGINLPGSALMPAPYGERLKSSLEAGRTIVSLVMNSTTVKQVIAKESVRNAIKVTMVTRESTNVVLHITAITNEAKLDMNVTEEFRTLDPTTPQIVEVSPAAKWGMEAFYRAGDIPRVIDRLGSIIDRSAVTCTGKSVGEDLEDQVYWCPKDCEIIKTVDELFSRTGGVTVLLGNLTPDTAISKSSAIDPALHRFTEKTRCYGSEEGAESVILSGEIQKGGIVVIHYEGSKGGPGMGEMFKAMKYIYGMGLAKDMALITDGRLSGTNSGCFMGRISLEAAEGDPLALVEDGDEIMIDVAEGKPEFHISDEIISARRKHWVKPKKEIPNSYLKLYPKMASSADKGVIIQCWSDRW